MHGHEWLLFSSSREPSLHGGLSIGGPGVRDGRFADLSQINSRKLDLNFLGNLLSYHTRANRQDGESNRDRELPGFSTHAFPPFGIADAAYPQSLPGSM